MQISLSVFVGGKNKEKKMRMDSERKKGHKSCCC